uniref:Uncharacterized protein n=1 Tax=Haemonchus contortus TaxID=6289 RepID=W6ND53_HAECO
MPRIDIRLVIHICTRTISFSRFSTDAGHEFEVVNSSAGFPMENKLLYFAPNQTKGQAEAFFNCLRYRMFRLQGI